MRELTLSIPVEQAYDEGELRARVCRELGLSSSELVGYQLVKRSVDARRRPIKGRVVLKVFEEEAERVALSPRAIPLRALTERELRADRPTLLIVGAGPAGLFAALRALSLGVKPIVLERGATVRERRRDLAQLNRTGEVNPQSNYCFGEGGAGTYSDGKLYTRAKKRGAVSLVLQLLADHGAPAEICYEAHPHIGTNRLPQVIASIREAIIAQGGELRFHARVTELLIEREGHERRLRGVRLASGEELRGSGVVLATGHSARDVFEMLDRQAVQIEAKPFALGVRIEHPQELIDRIQYHGPRPAVLGSASYKLVTQARGRGVFSFCMCPGGIIAPAATASHEVVVNGWSPYKRNGRFANSGLVVAVEDDDFEPFASQGALKGLAFQRSIERSAYEQARERLSAQGEEGRSLLTAPAQRLEDFLKGRLSSSLPSCSYVPGLVSAPLDELLPPQLTERLQIALRAFGERMRGYSSPEALMVGVESRTSSPVRIPRDRVRLEHPELRGLYPCGEGAGYAGGIMSAALDGMRCAEAALASHEASGDAWAEFML